jgi:uncharacterized repeat protein (TIGR03803 family)
MKTCIHKTLLLLPVLMATICLMLGSSGTAQTFTTLHNFTETIGTLNTNSDGAVPFGGLLLSGSSLYGTAEYGGSAGFGTIFAVKTDGTGFTNLKSFSGLDGGYPEAGLVLSNNILYGTTRANTTVTPVPGSAFGNPSYGEVYAVNTDGSGFSLLHIFTNNGDGANPYSGTLVLSSNTLYGTTAGTDGVTGTVFAVNIDGSDLRTLHTFSGNSDGGSPEAGLILAGQTLFGATSLGGISNNGTVYALSTDGTGFRTVHRFTPTDGQHPQAPLILSGNILYGITSGDGGFGFGTVFAVNTDGTNFTVLHNFNVLLEGGAGSTGGLVLSGNTLYGTIAGGVIYGNGAVFAIKTDGTGFTNLHIFTATDPSTRTNTDGADPVAGLVLSQNTLYGTTQYGGNWSDGTVFSISFAPQLSIVFSATDAILTWPINYAGFDYSGYTLQSTTNLVSPVWTTNSAVPVVVNGQNTVTNPISGTQQFFRLSQ